MKIIFFGSDPWFSPPVLEALLKAGHQVALIVTKGDALGEGRRTKDEGRKKIRFIQANNSNDISLDSLAHAFSLQPSAFGLSRPDAIVLASFGPPFLSSEVLKWPKYGCLNVHASLLPRWRGASPVFGAIANGDIETGVSIMRMTEKIDLGPVLGQKRTVIDSDTRETLTKRLGILGGELIVEKLKNIENGQINKVKQPSKSPTPYTHRLTKDLGRIDWKKSPVEIERFIRAVTPWPGALANAKFKVQSSKFKVIELKILKAHLEGCDPCHPSIARIASFRLIIDEVQLPGKNPVSWKQFLAGHPGAELG